MYGSSLLSDLYAFLILINCHKILIVWMNFGNMVRGIPESPCVANSIRIFFSFGSLVLNVWLVGTHVEYLTEILPLELLERFLVCFPLNVFSWRVVTKFCRFLKLAFLVLFYCPVS